MKYRLLLPLILLSYFSFAQKVEYFGLVSGKGIIFSEEESPFWFHSNQRGRVDEASNMAAWISGGLTYGLTPKASFITGIGGLYRDGYSNNFRFDEIFMGYRNRGFQIYAGRKQQEELYNGLSVSNANILWSLNARPLPGISISTTRPVYFWRSAGLAFEASLEEFVTDDDRYVDNTRIHHKSFHLVYDKKNNFQFRLGIQHFVQWAGTSPVFGKLPGGFSNYINVFIGTEGADDVSGEEANALGNHLGSYEVGIKTSIGDYDIDVIYNHLFEDGSGRILRNTPDGRYAIFVEDKEKGKWIDSFIYEFYYTRNQSKSTPTSDGADNYFNNNLYRSGWTYESRVLGVPFFTVDEERFRIETNNLIAHHIGFSGIAFNNLPYKILTSYRRNYGAKNGTKNVQSEIISTYFNLFVYKGFIDVNFLLGADFNLENTSKFGAGIEISRRLF